MGAVAVGERIERVGVGAGAGPPEFARGIVVVPGEIPSSDDLGCREGAGLDESRVVVGMVLRVARATELGVQVVDARVDDGDAGSRRRSSSAGSAVTIRLLTSV